MDKGPRRIASLRKLREYVREDLRANGRSLAPGFQAVAIYHFGVWSEGIRPRLLRVPMRAIHLVCSLFVRNFYGIELPTETRIGRRFRIAHQSGIVINPKATIGDDCLVRQGVTIGAGTRAGLWWKQGAKLPVIGDRVEIGPGAVIIGPITVGDGVVVAPNAVVMRNVPAGSIVAPPQSRIVASPPRRQAASTPAGGERLDGMPQGGTPRAAENDPLGPDE